MDAIWGACEGYTGIDGVPVVYQGTHAQEPAAYYIAFRDETVQSITVRLRRAADDSSDRT